MNRKIKRNKKMEGGGERLHFPLLIFLVSLLLTVMVWDHYFNSQREFDRLIASNLILLMGSLFSFMAGLFVWSLEKNLAYSEEERDFVDSIIKSMLSPLIIFSLDGNIETVNRAALNLLGYQEGELTGKPAKTILTEDFLSKEKIENLLHGGLIKQLEKTYLTKNGKRIPVLFSASVLRDSRGKVHGIVCVAQDISERKRLEKHLFQAEQMNAVGRLAAGIAHDFNNLLIVVAGYSEFLLDALDPRDPKRADTERIRELAARGANLTRQLLALSGRQIVEPKVVNLNTLILNTDRLLREFLGEDIELVTLPEQELEMVKVDPHQIEQVLINLVVNARDAMRGGGKLVIQTENVKVDAGSVRPAEVLKQGDYVMFSVSDTGTGMSEEIMEHIFEPYFTTKRKEEGTGLGLATVYGMIKQAGGHITVSSEAGRGTTFKIFLPSVKAPEDVLEKAQETKPLQTGKETILLVEDEPLVRNLMVRVLGKQGYRLIETANGSEALRLVEEQADEEIHLLLTDLVMPQIGGKEIAYRLKAIRPKLKVLFTSGYTDSPFIHHEGEDPNVGFIQKPFSPHALASKVREILDRP